MSEQPGVRARISSVTWIGLLIALFAMLVIRQTVSHFWPATTFTGALWKESLIWVSAIVLLILVRRGERLPFTSIGLGTSTWWKSVLWGLVIAIACAVVGGALAALTGYGHWTGGWANILIALALGAILAGFYLWRRDLVANMLGHFLVDFAANILPALFQGKS